MDLNFLLSQLVIWLGYKIVLIEKLRIEKLFAVIGGSMGGMQALEWATQYGK